MAQNQHLKFRTVLPHEPFPQEDAAGYIHLQGAFEPKKKDPEDAPYWTTSTLEEALFDALSNNCQSLKLPHPVESIQVLDPSPPFTKVRLTYASTLQALEVTKAWRSQKVAPSHLFSSLDTAPFGSHTCQATMITTTSIPPTSWTRSNPPKFRRLLHDNDDHEERSNTRFVFVTGLLQDPNPQSASFWNQPHAIMEAIRRVWNPHDSSGTGVEVFLSKKKFLPQACHIGMRSAKDCQRVVKELQSRSVTWEYNGEKICSGPLFLDYASVTQRSLSKSNARAEGDEPEKGEVSRPQCTSTTDSVHVPGLVVIEEYLTKAQDEILMAVLTGPQAPWAPDQTNKSQTGAVKRLVQHYGYVFDYKTADVLRDRQQPGANCPPMPAVQSGTTVDDHVENGRGWDALAGVIEKTRNYEFEVDQGEESDKRFVSYPRLNQLTLNHYKPGEGIGSHVDTPSAFGDGLMSITLNGGIVMEFRKVGNTAVKKLVYLPPRSLVLMSGPARYEWEHHIVTRRTDTHNGVVLPRKLRVSLTLRTALMEEGAPLPLVESRNFPPTWGGEKPSKALATPATERDHVHAVYDAIATQWHHTRGKRGVLWPGATLFLQHLPPGSVVADVGCGDGKYFPAIWEAGSYVIGTDISRPLLETAFCKSEATPDTRKVSVRREYLRDRPAVAVADCMSVPLRSKSCDAAICIAVMHHLSTRERRIRCIEELVRIVRKGGMINIQAWAMEQQQNSRRRFAASDVFVPFNAQPKYLEKVDTMGSQERVVNLDVGETKSKSVAEMYSEAYTKADFDEKKGLVVFQRYCHLYRHGEMEEIVKEVAGARLVESGYESGNHFVILEVTA
jgi:alkylated DNA repair dioxygenase AlkB/SAM-dependent methyltransferase